MDPQEIDSVQFKTTRLKGGYSADEVDAFLDRVALYMKETGDALAASEAARARLRKENAVLKQQLDTYGDLPTTQIPMQATGILEAAQRVAGDVEATARAKAEETVHEADKVASDIITGAQKEARETKYAALDACNKTEARMNAMQDRHDSIRDFVTSHLDQLKEEMDARA